MFSDEFLALSSEEQSKRIKDAGTSDPSTLPSHIQDLIKDAVQTSIDENGPFPEPIVKDHRSSENAA